MLDLLEWTQLVPVVFPRISTMPAAPCHWYRSHCRFLGPVAAAAALLLTSPSSVATNALLSAALNSITAEELHDHVAVLADDVYEGRAAGTRGGHAAGQYIVKQLKPYALLPAGAKGDYYQPYGENGGRNILLMLPGNDPNLEQEVVVLGAHYDHVGYGSKKNSFGPTGEIHNGADDNASGVSELLEAIQAFASTGLTARRSILFAFWDGEEAGLVGSKHWLTNPTVPLGRVKLAFTIDMVGRLREGRLQVLGTRTAYGMRRLLSGPVDDSMWLDFSWELSANSDHWGFVERRVPVVVLHTGLHKDYHRPGDDVEKINSDGMREVGQYLLAMLVTVANVDELPKYREKGKQETLTMQRKAEQALPQMSLASWPTDQPPPRLGISWRTDDAAPGAVCLSRVVAGTPAAAAGLAAGDRIYEIDGQPFADENTFETQITERLNSSVAFKLLVENRGHLRKVEVQMPSISMAE